MVWVRFLCKEKDDCLWSVNRTVGCFDPSIRNSYSVSVYIMAVHSLILELRVVALLE